MTVTSLRLRVNWVAAHTVVTRVEFAGSRSRGTHEQLSDWDFAVETSDFGQGAPTAEISGSA
jgi:predicted nucleotidyltransferase